MLKLLHVSDWVNGGLATYIESVSNHQNKTYEVHILASKTNSEDRIIQRDDFVELQSYERSLLGLLKAMIQFHRYIKNNQPDIVYIHSSYAGIFARFVLFFQKKCCKVIYCAHGWSFLMDTSVWKKKLYIVIEKIFSIPTDTIISISDNEYNAALAVGINSEKLIQINHGISSTIDKLDKSHSCAKKFDNKKINILFIGRYDKAKGFDWLMDFIRNNEYENVLWHCAGMPVVDEEIPIPMNVINHKWVKHEEISQLLLRCDVVIIPSRWEGFGLSALEAMKYKKPIIASRNGALRQLVHSEENGWLFDLNHFFELNKIIMELDVEILRKYGKKSFDIFEKKYSENIMFKQLDCALNMKMKS